MQRRLGKTEAAQLLAEMPAARAGPASAASAARKAAPEAAAVAAPHRAVGPAGSQDALHRAWVAVGERLASFNGKSGDELLDRELFYTLLEVRLLTERFRRPSNRVRPHNSLGCRPPAPEALWPACPVPLLVGLT